MPQSGPLRLQSPQAAPTGTPRKCAPGRQLAGNAVAVNRTLDQRPARPARQGTRRAGGQGSGHDSGWGAGEAPPPSPLCPRPPKRGSGTSGTGGASSKTPPTPSSCPAACAHCHKPDPHDCPAVCQNATVFCGCSGIMFGALDAARSCCPGLRGLTLLICEASISRIEALARGLFGELCEAGKEGEEAREGGGEHGAFVWPGISSEASGPISQALPPAGLQQSAAAASYVGAHRLGAACVAMLDDVEREHAALARPRGTRDRESDPDLAAAAAQIAGRAAGALGHASPGLEGAVRDAMAAAWTAEGPGADAEEVCEVILRHHDSM